jgi:hypothetical protein
MLALQKAGASSRTPQDYAAPLASLECGGLPPLCSPLRGFAKIKSNGEGKIPG